ncbi:allantoate amidohydrolase [Spirosoma daeguense]
MADFKQRAENVLRKIDELATVSDDTICLTRTYGSRAFLQGSQLVRQWMQEVGLQTRIDSIGNVRGRLNCPFPEAKTFVLASHIDTVINAGKFDGPLGIIVGLDLIAQLTQSGKSLPFHIELIAFSDEEGVRFHTTYLGSKVIAGSFEQTLLSRCDTSGNVLANVMTKMGCVATNLATDAIPKENWLGYLEIHIEQGPVLYERNVPIAVVSGIAGQKRIEITFEGVAGHAGTVPMNMRQDALCAASEFILAVEQLATSQPNLVATVGKLNVVNAASNVIPGVVSCSLDVRSNDNALLIHAYQALQDICESIGFQRSVQTNWNLIQETHPVACDTSLCELLSQSILESGYELIELVSGAGHDAVPISAVAPVSMLFVRCFEGISHNPLEAVDVSDIAATLQVGDDFMNRLIEQNMI